MRRSACLTVALAVLWSATVMSGSALGAHPDTSGVYVPATRAEDPGTDERPEKSDQSDSEKTRQEEICPVEEWSIALPIEGLACVLLLPKPAEDSGNGARNGDGNRDGNGGRNVAGSMGNITQ